PEPRPVHRVQGRCRHSRQQRDLVVEVRGRYGPRAVRPGLRHHHRPGVPPRGGEGHDLLARFPDATTSTSRTSASRIFSRAPLSVSPSDQQPGSPGTETLIPSSVRWSRTLYRMGTSPLDDIASDRIRRYPLEDDSRLDRPSEGGTQRKAGSTTGTT